MHEAKTRLSQLVEAIESGRERQIIIARNGRPIARLVAISGTGDTSKRIGVARGKFTVPEPSEELDQKVAELFVGKIPE